MKGEKTVKILNDEVERIEDKGALYPLSIPRRFFVWAWKKLSKELEYKSTSIMLEVSPTKKTSVMDFDNHINGVFDKLNLQINDLCLVDKEEKKVYFKALLDYSYKKDEYMEDVDSEDEVFSDFEENIVDSATLEIIPQNNEVLSINPEKVFLLVLNFFYKFQTELSKEVTNECKHILTLYYKKGRYEKIQKLKKELIAETSLNIYSREDNVGDKLCIVIPADLINHPKIRDTITKLLK